MKEALDFSQLANRWRSCHVLKRCECLLSLASRMRKDSIHKEDNLQSRLIQYQARCTASLISDSQPLDGPTGESNELYFVPKGLVVLLVDSEQCDMSLDEHKQQQLEAAALAMLSAALTAGNSVLFVINDQALCSVVESINQWYCLAQPLVSALPISALPIVATLPTAQLSNQQLAQASVVGFVGSQSACWQLNRQLSLLEGPIISLVAETDLDNIPSAYSPHLALQFMVEKTRTINLAAVGGNASLLQSGN
ncbi:hypothetical protein [Vibrio hippocampi]|uniref:1-pyrroline-5-carboxylate dehydrogenase n=1 Tax=Vibrio hippocampi TaxID=654686 RepID=A0ABM8ZNY1_9VIBR|nr:hypothetical protein [Vibrio hippocampi]CAH0530383.1 hypothetical protein VHP8226_04026 [Vibrio hippocampi]